MRKSPAVGCASKRASCFLTCLPALAPLWLAYPSAPEALCYSCGPQRVPWLALGYWGAASSCTALGRACSDHKMQHNCLWVVHGAQSQMYLCPTGGQDAASEELPQCHHSVVHQSGPPIYHGMMLSTSDIRVMCILARFFKGARLRIAGTAERNQTGFITPAMLGPAKWRGNKVATQPMPSRGPQSGDESKRLHNPWLWRRSCSLFIVECCSILSVHKWGGC